MKLPFDSFVGSVRETRPTQFDPRRLARITIMQGLDDAKPHTVYIDEIVIGDDVSNSSNSSTVPVGLSAKGYDRHIDLPLGILQSPSFAIRLAGSSNHTRL